VHVCSCVHGDELAEKRAKRKEGQKRIIEVQQEGNLSKEGSIQNFVPGQIIYPLNASIYVSSSNEDIHPSPSKFAYSSDMNGYSPPDAKIGMRKGEVTENSSDDVIDEGSGSRIAEGNDSDDSMTVDNGLFSYMKPFVCPFTNCGKKYSQKSSLNAHIRSHTGDKPFICPDCGKSFSRKPSMKRHRLAHSGEKPFNCEMCSKSFSRKDVLYSHMKRAHCLQIEGVEGESVPISES
jgi:uncharacterized C2H2 Zn-finger protein